MTATTASVSPQTFRRRRLLVAGAAVGLVVLVGGFAAAPLSARLFDVLVALGAVTAAWALAHELRTPLPAPTVPALAAPRLRVATVARPGVRRSVALADAA